MYTRGVACICVAQTVYTSPNKEAPYGDRGITFGETNVLSQRRVLTGRQWKNAPYRSSWAYMYLSIEVCAHYTFQAPVVFTRFVLVQFHGIPWEYIGASEILGRETFFVEHFLKTKPEKYGVVQPDGQSHGLSQCVVTQTNVCHAGLPHVGVAPITSIYEAPRLRSSILLLRGTIVNRTKYCY